MEKSVKTALLSKNCEEHIYFENISELMSFAEEYNPATVNLGPRIIEFGFLSPYDDLSVLKRMNLFNVRGFAARSDNLDRHPYFQELQTQF